ncbi:hypothetical protein [Herbaspirillum frisingense]|uniref:Uncharacterized protein n=1 Tax=Herbaspirillum frisingense TaxID=92645 RepID=A0ABU1PJQ0_9BURK|nr:hypothetical protein [Herbaspirillum frisingense]MDR6585553.1 hypothetical protein [Herbaspirillum frisingense]
MGPIKKGFLTFPELMERWQIDQADIFHLLAEKKLFASIFLNEVLDCYTFNEKELSWDLFAHASDLELDLEDKDYEVIYENVKVKGFYYLNLERESLQVLTAHEVEDSHPRSKSRRSMWHLNNRVVTLQFGWKDFGDDDVVFIKNEVERCEREKVVALDDTSQTQSALIEKLKNTELALAEAEKTIDGQRKIIEEQGAVIPHNVLLMKIAIEVQRDYWQDISSPPKQEALIAELMAKYRLSEVVAKAVERVACPINRGR